MLKIIKASAGSGKTFTLTREYIALLLAEKSDGNKAPILYKVGKNGYPREYHRHILAMTFTNKATEEMKQRIVKELAILAGIFNNGKSDHLDFLCNLFNASEDDIREASKNALTELLFDYTNFNISTIDSFFQIILRTFAAEVEIPYDYNIELSEEYAMRVGIHDFLTEISSNQKKHSQVLSWLNKYVLSQLQNGSSWNLFKSGNSSSSGGAKDSLFTLASDINKEFFRNVHSEMEKYLNFTNGNKKIGLFHNLVNEKIKETKQDVSDIVENVNFFITNSGYNDLRKKTGCMASWIAKADMSDFEYDSDEIKSLQKLYDDNKSIFNKTPKNLTDPPASIQETVHERCGEILELAKLLFLYQSIAKNIYQLGLLGYINHSVLNFRQENNLILLSDTSELLSDIISEQDAPFIYERIGTRVNNFLIDEFQDTSAMQWQNMKPLLSQSLSCGNENLIIGDEKQCIYRFRNSDPSLLQTKVQAEFSGYIHQPNSESHNWRSTPNIIKFNNTLFSKFSDISKIGDIYSNVIQFTNNKDWGTDGYVRINVVSPDKVKNGETKSVLERIPDLICDMLDRGYEQRDIAILVDRNTEGADVITSLLEYNKQDGHRYELNVVSNESLLLDNSPSIRLIISHLRYLAVSISLNEDNGAIKNEKSLNEKLHRLLRQYEQQINAGSTPEQALEHCFSESDDKESALRDIRDFMPENCESYSLVSIVERIIEKVLSTDALRDENPFIQAFQDLVIDFCSRGDATILTFLRWWDRIGHTGSINSPSGSNAITVMTIHKSKGLEFNCVIIPFANWSIGKVDSTIWYPHEHIVKSKIFDGADPDIIPPLTPVKSNEILYDSPLSQLYKEKLNDSIVDCMNKTYVAFTRAVYELHIFTEAYKEDNKKSSQANPQRLNYYFDQFFKHQTEETAQQLNELFADKIGENSADIALSMQHCTDANTNEDFYEVGQMKPFTSKNKPQEEVEKGKSMPEYKVINRHNLAEFKLPQVFYTAQQEEGTILHSVLSYIRYAKDVQRALFYCKTRFIIPPEKYDHICGIISEIIDQNDEVKSWFADGNQVYNECTILSQDKRSRPDRIIVTPSGDTIVIDYKFGNPEDNKYKKQVHDYMHLLHDAGFKNITGKIWYPLKCHIDTVTL